MREMQCKESTTSSFAHWPWSLKYKEPKSTDKVLSIANEVTYYLNSNHTKYRSILRVTCRWRHFVSVRQKNVNKTVNTVVCEDLSAIKVITWAWPGDLFHSSPYPHFKSSTVPMQSWFILWWPVKWGFVAFLVTWNKDDDEANANETLPNLSSVCDDECVQKYRDYYRPTW